MADGVKVILVFVLIFLAIITAFLGLRLSSVGAKMATMDEIRLASEDLLYYGVGQDCKSNGDAEKTLDCLDKALAVADFSEDGFENIYSPEDKVGFIVIKNDAAITYSSSHFRLYLNRELVDSDCHIPGDINAGYTCRLEFPRACTSGDVLEVTYDYANEGEEPDESRVFVRTCN